MRRIARLWPRKKRRGEITLEWILLASVLVIGIIGGLGVARNAIISEMNDIAQAVMALEILP